MKAFGYALRLFLDTRRDFTWENSRRVAGTLTCYPLDLLKLNMQVAGEGGAKREHTTTVQFASHIFKRDGIKGMYTGLTASMLRQALYTGFRLGTFQVLIDYYTVDDKPPNILVKMLCGCAAGALGGLTGLPPDVALTRMAVDKQLPADKRRHYTHVFNAMARIQREEGSATLFRGAGATIIRAMVVNVSQLLSYVETKNFLIKRNITGDNATCHMVSSFISSAIATFCVLPPDIAKTRLQNMRIVDGKPEYKHILDVWFKVISKEGPLALWKGFTPLLIRNGPQYLVVFVVYERLMKYFKKMTSK